MSRKKTSPKPFQTSTVPAPRNAHIVPSAELRAYSARLSASLPAWREEQFRKAAARMRALKSKAYSGPVTHPVRIGDIA
jgi:hypothetical protein